MVSASMSTVFVGKPAAITVANSTLTGDNFRKSSGSFRYFVIVIRTGGLQPRGRINVPYTIVTYGQRWFGAS